MSDQIEAIDLDQQIKKGKKDGGKMQRRPRARNDSGRPRGRRGSQQLKFRSNGQNGQRRMPRARLQQQPMMRRTGGQLRRRVVRSRRPPPTGERAPLYTNPSSSSKEARVYELQPNVVFKGLGTFVTDQKLREICQGYGPMDMCKLDRDAFGNIKPQGIGLVKFENIEDAEKIVTELDGVKIVEDEGAQQAGGQISVKLIESNDPNWRRQLEGGILNIRRRGPFKITRGSNRRW